MIRFIAATSPSQLKRWRNEPAQMTSRVPLRAVSGESVEKISAAKNVDFRVSLSLNRV